MNRDRVLFVDDDRVQLVVVGAWLQSAGYVVIPMSTPFGASAAVLRERPRIVLLDVAMPGLDGEALVEAIRCGRAADTAIIFHSGKDWKVLRDLSERHGVLGFIEKTPDAQIFMGRFKALVQMLPAG